MTYTRRRKLELYERQNEIAALAQTTADSVEQLRIAEQLPQKLQETTRLSAAGLAQSLWIRRTNKKSRPIFDRPPCLAQ